MPPSPSRVSSVYPPTRDLGRRAAGAGTSSRAEATCGATRRTPGRRRATGSTDQRTLRLALPLAQHVAPTTVVPATAPARDPAARRSARGSLRGLVRARRSLLVLAGAAQPGGRQPGHRARHRARRALPTPTAPTRPRSSTSCASPAPCSALVVGVALGIAGALMQGHTRNPLADPGLLGVTAGAAFAVVLGIFVFGVTGLTGYAWFSLAGAGLAAAAVFAIGSTRGGPNPVSLVLAGTAVSALLVVAHPGDRAARPRHPRRLPVLGGRLGRRPRHGRLLAGRCRSSSSACCSPRSAPRASTCSSSATTSPARSACTRCATR